MNTSNYYTIIFIRLLALMQITGLPRSSIYAKMNPLSSTFDPSFPIPVKLSRGPRGAVAWKLHEVEEWMKTRPTISRNLVKKGSVENHDNS